LDKIAVLDKSISGLEVKDARNEAQVAVLQQADEKLTVSIEALQVRKRACDHYRSSFFCIPSNWRRLHELCRRPALVQWPSGRCESLFVS